MQQSKISTFFKPSPSASYSSSPGQSDCSDGKIIHGGKADANPSHGSASSSPKILNKKQSYVQYHLEFGQSDFLLHSCSVCGMMYACGDETDEKLHRAFHKNYYEGILFKGWHDERVVTSGGNGGRILLVINSDPPSHKRKVKEVLKILEKELGFSDGHLLNKLCKVYLFVLSHRIVGCLVAEPIRTAHRVITSSSSGKRSNGNCLKLSSSNLAQNSERKLQNLQFGEFCFKREVFRKSDSANRVSIDKCDSGAVLCEEESVPAVCGFQAIWVVPSQRRKQIASELLDAARKSFCPGEILDCSQCAFSPPTSSGRALASSYFGTNAYLIYRAADASVPYIKLKELEEMPRPSSNIYLVLANSLDTCSATLCFICADFDLTLFRFAGSAASLVGGTAADCMCTVHIHPVLGPARARECTVLGQTYSFHQPACRTGPVC